MVRRIQTRTKNSNNLINEYFSKLAIIDNQLTRSLAAVAAMTRNTHTTTKYQQHNYNLAIQPFPFLLVSPCYSCECLSLFGRPGKKWLNDAEISEEIQRCIISNYHPSTSQVLCPCCRRKVALLGQNHFR
jgi:hypothetical protein